jgi:hypothetical protein
VNVTLEDIGNLGELIAATATIATLAYLALQIKLNTKSNQSSTASAWFERESTICTLIAQHATIYRRGNANLEELNEDEAVVYMQIVSVEIGDVWSGMIQYKNGLISESDLATYEVIWKNFMARPGFRSAWLGIRGEYAEDFCQWVDSFSASPKGEVPPLG